MTELKIAGITKYRNIKTRPGDLVLPDPFGRFVD